MLLCLPNQTNDYCAIPQHLKDELTERYPEARRAYLKSGGDFPFLSRPDEVNLHLQVHIYSVSKAKFEVYIYSVSTAELYTPKVLFKKL